MGFFHRQIKREFEDPLFLTGVVTNFNSTDYTVDVKLNDLASLPAVPILGVYGPGYGRDTSMLSSYRGSRVLLVRVNNVYHVLSTMPERSGDSGLTVSSPVSGPEFAGTDPSSYQKTACKECRAGRPADILSGDKILSTDGGSLLALFREGMAKLKAAPLAQIILFKYKELVRIVGRRVQIFSDFGEIELFSDGSGKTGFSIKGGGDLATESHPGVAKHTVEIYGGTCPEGGDIRLQAKVGSPDGGTYYKTTIGAKGTATIESTDGLVACYEGSENVAFLDGSYKVVVGDANVMQMGNSTQVVTGKYAVISVQSIEFRAPSFTVTSADVTFNAGSFAVYAADVTLCAPLISLDSALVKVNGVFSPKSCTLK